MTIDNNKMEALNEALKKIEKEHGKGSVMKLGETSGLDVDSIPTGVIGLEQLE